MTSDADDGRGDEKDAASQQLVAIPAQAVDCPRSDGSVPADEARQQASEQLSRALADSSEVEQALRHLLLTEVPRHVGSTVI